MEENELDKYKWNYTKEIRKDLKVGSLILAQPFLNDTVFKRAVCIMCAHNKIDGSFGFIVNKKSNFIISDFIKELDHFSTPVYYGGPVATDSLFFIHDNQLEITGANKIADNVYWGGDFDEMKTKLSQRKEGEVNIKFFMGYSGWDNGQLRKEIIENSWIVTNKEVEQVFSSSKNLWKKIMTKMGNVYAHLANSPENPDLN